MTSGYKAMDSLSDLRKKLDRMAGRGTGVPPVMGSGSGHGRDGRATVSEHGQDARATRGRDVRATVGGFRIERGPVDLMAALSGTEVRGRSGGRALMIEQDVRNLTGGSSALCDAFRSELGREGSPVRRWIADRCEAESPTPRDLLFVDLETTGLGGTPLFLVGTMGWEGLGGHGQDARATRGQDASETARDTVADHGRDARATHGQDARATGGLVVRQYFARDYSEERAVIALFLELAADKRLLVSFNGKSFDLPYVRLRAAANALPFAVDAAHFDLLHVSRRVWRGRLPDCRLQTLERCVCGRMRCGDIPGSEIPQAYHDFVRTGDARQIVEILRHNMMDLVTLADLMVRLPNPEEDSPRRHGGHGEEKKGRREEKGRE